MSKTPCNFDIELPGDVKDNYKYDSKNNKKRSKPMSKNLEDMKKKREQLDVRIAQAESRLRAQRSKDETTVKVLVGSAVLNAIKNGSNSEKTMNWLVGNLQSFLTRDRDRAAVLGSDGKGSEAFKRLSQKDKPVEQGPSKPEQA